MKLRPLGDKVVIKKAQAEEKTHGGIIIPGVKNDTNVGEVVEVGPGGVVGGHEVIMTVTKGDKVIYDAISPIEYKLDGEELMIIGMDQILAVIE